MNYPSPNIEAYSKLRQDASAGMLGLDNMLWKKGFDSRETGRRRAQRDMQRDRKYSMFGQALGSVGQIGALAAFRQPQQPATQIPGYNIAGNGNVTLQGGYGVPGMDDEIRRILGI